MHHKHHFSGIVFLAFLFGSFVMCGLFLQSALAETGFPVIGDVIKGKWPPQFEKSLNKILPLYNPSCDFWGRTEYGLFHQGRKGVVVGADGWLFTDEEFSCSKEAEKDLAENLSYMSQVQKELAQKNAQLAVIVVPEKARLLKRYLYQAELPPCRQPLYGQITSYLRDKRIRATDLLTAMRAMPAPGTLYLKTDTHWSPAGARLASKLLKVIVSNDYPALMFNRRHFTSTPVGVTDYKGDLTRYVPGLEAKALPPDKLQGFTTDSPSAGGGLLGDGPTPQVVLVGTSYSANPKWNFEGFLKESLQTDIYNAADEGQGPFTVMDKYLQGDVWKNNPPKLVIWELPERYFLMPHGVES